MTWKHVGEGKYDRQCRVCGGTGTEHLDHWKTKCGCPYDHCEYVDHPGNASNLPDCKDRGILWQVTRCDICGMFWCLYFESQDDSWDVPSPECLGRDIPPDDWRPGRAKGAKQ